MPSKLLADFGRSVVKRLGRALALIPILMSVPCWAQTPTSPVLKTVMADVDKAAPGVKPDKAISATLSRAMDTLSSKINDGTLTPNDLALAHLYNAKAWYFLAVNDHAFTVADYDREDARAYVYEFEQSIELMWEQAAKTGKDWNAQIADANWQAANMVLTLAVDTNRAYSRFLPACAALGHPDCKRMMESARK